MIEPMKRILLAGRVSDREKLLLLLRDADAIHVEPFDPDQAKASPEQLREIERTAKALLILKGYPPATEGIAPPGTPARLVKEVHEAFSRMKKLEKEIVELNAEKEAVAPWGRINSDDIAVLEKAGLNLRFFTCPESAQDQIPGEFGTVINRTAGVCYLFCVSRTAFERPDGWAEIPVPPRDAAAAKGILEELSREVVSLKDSMKGLSRRRAELEDYQAELEENRRFTEVDAGLKDEGPLFFLQGWLPVSKVEGLNGTVESGKIPVGIILEDPEEDENPPTRLDMPWWCTPVRHLYSFMGIVPGYREGDVSPIFFPAMIIFAGMLIADAGYGLLALIAVGAAYPTLIKKGVEKDLIYLFGALFAGVTIYGVLTNTYFGETLIRLSPVDNNTQEGRRALKKLCFFLGAIHLTIARGLKARAEKNLKMVADIGWIFFIWAMYALVCGLVLSEAVPFYMVPGFVIGSLMVLLFTETEGGIFARIGAGLGALAMNASGCLSDIISYIRLWAVGLAGGVLAQSFNSLARPMPILVAVMIILVGHSVNFILGMIAILAHGVRLNLLEFSNHNGLEWTGKEYNPFRKNHF